MPTRMITQINDEPSLSADFPIGIYSVMIHVCGDGSTGFPFNFGGFFEDEAGEHYPHLSTRYLQLNDVVAISFQQTEQSARDLVHPISIEFLRTESGEEVLTKMFGGKGTKNFAFHYK